MYIFCVSASPVTLDNTGENGHSIRLQRFSPIQRKREVAIVRKHPDSNFSNSSGRCPELTNRDIVPYKASKTVMVVESNKKEF